MKSRPEGGCLMRSAELENYISAARAAGCEIDRDKDAGTVVVTDGDTVVIRAIQKGNASQPWIVMFYNSDRVKWSKNGSQS